MTRTAITHSGDNSEDIFRSATGATKPAKKALGDAELDGHFIEIKAVGSTTLNQVRAVKYNTLVAHDTRHDHWYVVPAHIVVTLIARKKTRGQHTENPFESATLSLKDIAGYRIAGVSDLARATRQAISTAAGFPHLKALMQRILDASIALARRSITSTQHAVRAITIAADPDAT